MLWDKLCKFSILMERAIKDFAFKARAVSVNSPKVNIAAMWKLSQVRALYLREFVARKTS